MSVTNNKSHVKVNCERIPEQLTSVPNWLVWVREFRHGKPTKVPYDAKLMFEPTEPYRKLADATNSRSWATFDQAKKALSLPSVDGIGFALCRTNACGIDIDHCITDGVISDQALEIIRRLNSYTEISPSGTGIRIFIIASPPGKRCRTDNIEIYDHSRFLTVTGRHIAGTPLTVEVRQEELACLYRELFPAPPPTQPTLKEHGHVDADDEVVLDLALGNEKFQKLWHGDLSDVKTKADGSPDLSAADSAFCYLLAPFTRSREQIDRLFKESPLYRDKWEREDYRDRTIESALDAVEYRDKVVEVARWDRLEKLAEDLIGQAEATPAMVVDLPLGRAPDPKPQLTCPPDEGYLFRPLTGADFDATNYRMEWLVRRLLVANQPAILGGPKKVLKTSLLVDLTLSLGSGFPFLGSFAVNRPRRTVLISGESGGFTLQETARRVCASKGVRLTDTLTFWDFRLPQLSDSEEVCELRRGIAHRGIEVAIIDPLYLCLLAGSDDKSASNLYDMGPLLLRIANACLSVGCTPILAHHSRKLQQQTAGPLDLEDLAFSGVQEFARQWILVNRRKPYEPDSGVHHLWLSAGGSVGHGGLWGVTVNEGQLEEDFSGRRWEVVVQTLADVKADEVAAREAKKQSKEDELEGKYTELEQQLLVMLDSQEHPPTRSGLRRKLGWDDDRFSRILTRLTDRSALKVTEGTYHVGNGAIREGMVITRCDKKVTSSGGTSTGQSHDPPDAHGA